MMQNPDYEIKVVKNNTLGDIENHSRSMLFEKLLCWRYLGIKISWGGIISNKMDAVPYVILNTNIKDYAHSFDNFDIYISLKLKFYRGFFIDELEIIDMSFTIVPRGTASNDDKMHGKKAIQFEKHPTIKNIFYRGKVYIK